MSVAWAGRQPEQLGSLSRQWNLGSLASQGQGAQMERAATPEPADPGTLMPANA